MLHNDVEHNHPELSNNDDKIWKKICDKIGYLAVSLTIIVIVFILINYYYKK